MKLLFSSAILATVLTSTTTCCVAFTTPQVVSSQHSRLATTILPSTLVNDGDTISSQSSYISSDDDTLSITSTVQNTEEVAAQKKYLEDGFVFGLDGSGLERPKGKSANIVVEGDSLETTPQQVAIVSATFAGHALFAANAIHTLLEQTNGNVELTAATSIVTIVASWVLADFGSGTYDFDSRISLFFHRFDSSLTISLLFHIQVFCTGLLITTAMEAHQLWEI